MSVCEQDLIKKDWIHFYIKTGTLEVKYQSYYKPELPRGFQELKVPRLRDHGPGWW